MKGLFAFIFALYFVRGALAEGQSPCRWQLRLSNGDIVDTQNLNTPIDVATQLGFKSALIPEFIHDKKVAFIGSAEDSSGLFKSPQTVLFTSIDQMKDSSADLILDHVPAHPDQHRNFSTMLASLDRKLNKGGEARIFGLNEVELGSLLASQNSGAFKNLNVTTTLVDYQILFQGHLLREPLYLLRVVKAP